MEVNAVKADIDSITQQLDAKRQAAAAAAGSGAVEPGVLDDEHHQLLQQLKAAKARSVVHLSTGAGSHGGSGDALGESLWVAVHAFHPCDLKQEAVRARALREEQPHTLRKLVSD